MKNRLIYALRCPFTNEVHYIGKSTNGMMRPSQHLNNSHSKKIQIWVEELKTFGHTPIIDVLYYVSEQEDIDAVEYTLIKKHLEKGSVLLNSNLVHPLSITPELDEIDYSGIKLIGNFVKEKRRKTGLKQDDFASRCGVALTVIRKIEQGKDNINLSGLITVLSMFGCKLTIEKNI